MADRETGLAQLGRLPRRVVLDVAERLLLEHVSLLWDNGWQPGELHRHARIGASTTAVVRLVELAVAVDCRRRLTAGQELHPTWQAQAEELATSTEESEAGWLDRSSTSSGTPTTGDPASAYALVAGTLPVLLELPALDVLVPPPGQREVGGARRPTTTADPLLQRVRNLLARRSPRSSRPRPPH